MPEEFDSILQLEYLWISLVVYSIIHTIIVIVFLFGSKIEEIVLLLIICVHIQDVKIRLLGFVYALELHVYDVFGLIQHLQDVVSWDTTHERFLLDKIQAAQFLGCLLID